MMTPAKSLRSSRAQERALNVVQEKLKEKNRLESVLYRKHVLKREIGALKNNVDDDCGGMVTVRSSHQKVLGCLSSWRSYLRPFNVTSDKRQDEMLFFEHLDQRFGDKQICHRYTEPSSRTGDILRQKH